MWPLYSDRQSRCWLIWRAGNSFGDKSFANPRHETIFSLETFTSMYLHSDCQPGEFEMVMRYFSPIFSFPQLLRLWPSRHTSAYVDWGYYTRPGRAPIVSPRAPVLFTRESHNNLIWRTRIIVSFIIGFESRGCTTWLRRRKAIHLMNSLYMLHPSYCPKRLIKRTTRSSRTVGWRFSWRFFAH